MLCRGIRQNGTPEVTVSLTRVNMMLGAGCCLFVQITDFDPHHSFLPKFIKLYQTQLNESLKKQTSISSFLPTPPSQCWVIITGMSHFQEVSRRMLLSWSPVASVPSCLWLFMAVFVLVHVQLLFSSFHKYHVPVISNSGLDSGTSLHCARFLSSSQEHT